MSSDHRVVIVGGGLAGLFAGLALMAEGVNDVVVLEGQSSPGGLVRTIEREGFLVEPAAGSLVLPHARLSRLIEASGAELVAAAARDRYVYTRGRLTRIAPGPRLAVAPVLSIRGKLRAAAEPLVAGSDGDGSVNDRLTGRFGREAGSLLAWLAATGVYAGDPQQLSLPHAFPALDRLEAQHGSMIKGLLAARRKGAPARSTWIPRESMLGFAASLADSLGPSLVTGHPVERVERRNGRWLIHGSSTIEADQVVLAVDHVSAGRLIAGPMTELLRHSPAAPVAVVALGGSRKPDALPEGYGILTGPDAGLRTLGVLLESSYAPHRAPPGGWLVKVIAGGALHPEVVEWPDSEIIDAVGSELAAILDAPIEAGFTHVVRHVPGIPQYTSGHAAWLENLRDVVAGMPGLHLTGWSYRGVGVGHLAEDAFLVGAAVSEAL